MPGELPSLESLFDAAPDAMILVDGSGRIVQVNDEVERMFGWRRDELVGQPIETLVPSRARASHGLVRSAYVAAPRRRGMGSGMDLRGVRKDGSEISVEIGLSPIERGETGRFVLAAVRDTSERKAAERRAQVSLERLVSALESMKEAFAIFDHDDRLVLCNSAYRTDLVPSLGGAAVGAHYEELLKEIVGQLEAAPGSPEELLSRLLAYHREPVGALDVVTRDARHLRIQERSTPERGRIVTIADLTEDVRRQRELRAAREAADSANAAKSDLLRSMSHELRTPLNAVLGFAQLLQRDRALSDRSQRRVDHVVRGGEHLLRLIDDVLDLARVESGAIPLSCEPVLVREVLEDVCSTLGPLADKRGIEVSIDAIAAEVAVRADRTRLRQIVLNYGSNAIKYGREQGCVRLAARPLEAEEAIRLSVVDDGPGIAPERQGRLFQAFYRAGQETGSIEGTGIGLALSQRLAEMMGGSVGFSSTPGAGSEFWVQLPRASAARVAEPSRAPREVRTVGPTRSILYVEDNPANLIFMEEVVGELAGVELMTAPTGELGLELARVHKPALVILDINLPGMSGFEVSRRLREDPTTAAIPVIALSASAMESDVRRAEAAGLAHYLTKPVRIDRLLEVISELLPGLLEREA
ncbi:MAG: PAS domain S-box protein [Deltaproteobacteria bacterium]|jgi:PAS domain S-box-containing protein